MFERKNGIICTLNDNVVVFVSTLNKKLWGCSGDLSHAACYLALVVKTDHVSLNSGIYTCFDFHHWYALRWYSDQNCIKASNVLTELFLGFSFCIIRDLHCRYFLGQHCLVVETSGKFSYIRNVQYRDRRSNREIYYKNKAGLRVFCHRFLQKWKHCLDE